jgi:argonaute-like protein implicated in RNA metabolism and viral defense
MNISIQIEKKKVAHVSGIDVSIHLQPEKRTSPAFIVFFLLEDKIHKYSELSESTHFN